MKFDFTGFLYALSYALDAVEKEVSGATAEHGKRVAWLSWLCVDGCGFSRLEIMDLVACAILHDNAVSEYIREELNHKISPDPDYEAMRSRYGIKAYHVKIGEQKIRTLPFKGNIENIILWHHENADGTGPLGKTEDETNLFSQIIHLADVFDIGNDLPNITEEEFATARKMVADNTGTIFSHAASELFLKNVTWDRILEMKQKGPLTLLKENIPPMEYDFSDGEMMRIAQFFAGIVDYKSSFTKDHSTGVAQKAEAMAKRLGFPHDKMVRFAFAGAMHDIGKMVVGNNILEKPDKLNASEFDAMKNHAAETYKILHEISGLEDITQWASNHHEKLDGTGYPRRLSADEQTLEDRLMACIDIYQALTEKRPYKDGLSHHHSIKIMESMAADGKIDASIVREIDLEFGKDSEDTDDTEDVRMTTKQWKCQVCGYVYEGDTPPANCPICDSGVDEFSLI